MYHTWRIVLYVQYYMADKYIRTECLPRKRRLEANLAKTPGCQQQNIPSLYTER